VKPERVAGLAALEDRLGHRFADRSLLDRALTHTSYANEAASSPADHNEPLEFLGDSVLGLAAADLLHRRDPGGDEGTKSQARARLVSGSNLARHAEELGLPALLLLGRGEEKTGGRQRAALWADAFEAVVAALYLDGGLEAALRFVRAEFARDLGAPDFSIRDHKTALQEWLQAQGRGLPLYEVVAEEGPSHRPRFKVRCVLGGKVVGEGEGHSKKVAQQEAARRALEALLT